jgi:hypothetical protein
MANLSLMAQSTGLTTEHIIEIVSILSAVLVGGGALSFFLRFGGRMNSSETRLSGLEVLMKEKVRQVEGLSNEMNTVQTKLSGIERSLEELKDVTSRLYLIGEISTKLDYIAKAAEKAMPAGEFEGFKDYAKERMNSLEVQIHQTQAHISNECPLRKKGAESIRAQEE